MEQGTDRNCWHFKYIGSHFEADRSRWSNVGLVHNNVCDDCELRVDSQIAQSQEILWNFFKTHPLGTGCKKHTLLHEADGEKQLMLCVWLDFVLSEKCRRSHKNLGFTKLVIFCVIYYNRYKLFLVSNCTFCNCCCTPWYRSAYTNYLFPSSVELCKSFSTTGKCSYGARCQYAHGQAQLRPVTRHPKYKSRRCKNYDLGRLNHVTAENLNTRTLISSLLRSKHNAKHSCSLRFIEQKYYWSLKLVFYKRFGAFVTFFFFGLVEVAYIACFTRCAYVWLLCSHIRGCFSCLYIFQILVFFLDCALQNWLFMLCVLCLVDCKGARMETGAASSIAMKRRKKALANVAKRVTTKVTAKKDQIVLSMITRQMIAKTLVEVLQDFNNVIFAIVRWSWKHPSHRLLRSSTTHYI